MLRTDFDGVNKNGHKDDHLALHKAHNLIIYADDEPDIATALLKAEQFGIPRVILNPTGMYEISETLVIPPEIELDGSGRGLTSNAPISVQNRAEIIATTSLDPMIRLSNFSSVCGCKINGDMVAIGAIYAKDTIYNNIFDNLVCRVLDYGLKFGGCLFTSIKSNSFNQIGGYSLDALRAYGDTGYYGINVGISERNEWKGNKGHVRFEGILTSVSDDFEGFGVDGALVTIGGTVQSQLVMYHPYFEIKTGAFPIKAIRLNLDSHLSVHNAQAIGDANDPLAVFVECDKATQLSVTDSIVKRFGTVFSGTFRPTASVHIAGNIYANYQTLNGFSNLADVDSALCVWPGTKIGV